VEVEATGHLPPFAPGTYLVKSGISNIKPVDIAHSFYSISLIAPLVLVLKDQENQF
jgi:hypothetical protein